MMADSVLYTRELPGGGYVSIESIPETATAFRARVAVERRTDPLRRAGHASCRDLGGHCAGFRFIRQTMIERRCNRGAHDRLREGFRGPHVDAEPGRLQQ